MLPLHVPLPTVCSHPSQIKALACLTDLGVLAEATRKGRVATVARLHRCISTREGGLAQPSSRGGERSRSRSQKLSTHIQTPCGCGRRPAAASPSQ